MRILGYKFKLEKQTKVTSSALELTPKKAFAISLLYMASADGIIEQEEITYLSTVLHGDTKSIREANSYIKNAMKKNISFDTFLYEANKLLDDNQKECVIVNLVDMMLSDGKCDESEMRFLEHIIDIFGFDNKKFEIYKELMIIKNNHDIF